MTISAVLFDVDEVLLDPAAAHRRVWNSWSLARGLDPEKVWQLTFGRRPEDAGKEAPAAPADALFAADPGMFTALSCQDVWVAAMGARVAPTFVTDSCTIRKAARSAARGSA